MTAGAIIDLDGTVYRSDELRRGVEGLLGREPHLWSHPPRSADGFPAVGQHREMRPISETIPETGVAELDEEGFIVRSVDWNDQDVVVVTGPTDLARLYVDPYFDANVFVATTERR